MADSLAGPVVVARLALLVVCCSAAVAAASHAGAGASSGLGAALRSQAGPHGATSRRMLTRGDGRMEGQNELNTKQLMPRRRSLTQDDTCRDLAMDECVMYSIQGKCSDESFMRGFSIPFHWCKKTCGKCGTNVCADMHRECDSFAQDTRCVPGSIRENYDVRGYLCRRACGTCSGGLSDNAPPSVCVEYLMQGLCKTNVYWRNMSISDFHCRASCARKTWFEECYDLHRSCASWVETRGCGYEVEGVPIGQGLCRRSCAKCGPAKCEDKPNVLGCKPENCGTRTFAERKSMRWHWCPVTCRTCKSTTCVDIHRDCAKFKTNGRCETKPSVDNFSIPGYWCRRMCGVCSRVTG